MIVRPTNESDIEPILRIKQEPHVARFQYHVDIYRYRNLLSRVVHGNNKTGNITTRFSTLEQDGQVIGYVRHDHIGGPGVGLVYCAWNLTSDCWGQGIMNKALTQLFDEWIHTMEIQIVVADHFRSNLRCQRLLDRLQFESIGIPLMERVANACQQLCLHWIVRRRLNADTWKRVSPAGESQAND